MHSQNLEVITRLVHIYERNISTALHCMQCKDMNSALLLLVNQTHLYRKVVHMICLVLTLISFPFKSQQRRPFVLSLPSEYSVKEQFSEFHYYHPSGPIFCQRSIWKSMGMIKSLDCLPVVHGLHFVSSYYTQTVSPFYPRRNSSSF